MLILKSRVRKVSELLIGPVSQNYCNIIGEVVYISVTLSSVKRLYAQEGHYFDIACLPNQDCLDESKLKSYMYTGLGVYFYQKLEFTVKIKSIILRLILRM